MTAITRKFQASAAEIGVLMAAWNQVRPLPTMAPLVIQHNGMTGTITPTDSTHPVTLKPLYDVVIEAAEIEPTPGTLADEMPREFIGGEYDDSPAYKLKDVAVAKRFSTLNEANWKPWPGPHKHVHVWVLLVNGKAVGFNENPNRGWSFPVVGPAAISTVLD